MTINSQFNSADMDRVTAGATFTFCLIAEFWNRYSDKLSDDANEAFDAAYHGIRGAACGGSGGVNGSAFFRFTD